MPGYSKYTNNGALQESSTSISTGVLLLLYLYIRYIRRLALAVSLLLRSMSQRDIVSNSVVISDSGIRNYLCQRIKQISGSGIRTCKSEEIVSEKVSQKVKKSLEEAEKTSVLRFCM